VSFRTFSFIAASEQGPFALLFSLFCRPDTEKPPSPPALCPLRSLALLFSVSGVPNYLFLLSSQNEVASGDAVSESCHEVPTSFITGNWVRFFFFFPFFFAGGKLRCRHYFLPSPPSLPFVPAGTVRAFLLFRRQRGFS